MLTLLFCKQKPLLKNIPIVFEELPEDDPPRRKPDIRKAKKLLGWEPKVERKEGLSKMIKWFV